MKISVTQQDIDHGRKRLGDACPVALALCRIAATDDVWVGTDEARAGSRAFELPPEMAGFIGEFDERGGGAVRPAEFDVPDEDFYPAEVVDGEPRLARELRHRRDSRSDRWR